MQSKDPNIINDERPKRNKFNWLDGRIERISRQLVGDVVDTGHRYGSQVYKVPSCSQIGVCS